VPSTIGWRGNRRETFIFIGDRSLLAACSGTEAELFEITASAGLVDGKIVERFDCYEGTSAKAKLSKDLYVQGVNFFARKPPAYIEQLGLTFGSVS